MAKIDEIERDAVKKAAYFENRTEAQELEDHKWAVKNGLSFSGPGALSQAIAASKKRAATKARKSKVGTSFDPGVLEAFKAKAERVGIPYQTLLNSIVKRYTEGKLDIEPA
ncbi:BrnA antitoxin family protein [Fibrobacter sp.]|uniref:BrnA antitoxin family protein n=1 Tax=Fibrobacter sp. TaxID=35828 RepID=UPI0025BAACF5|nr:BrnA antitoxin family protein [Fibrobacter sp.]MBR3070666.1 BrnA antitoxin family protein [Fibrobacter sp.]